MKPSAPVDVSEHLGRDAATPAGLLPAPCRLTLISAQHPETEPPIRALVGPGDDLHLPGFHLLSLSLIHPHLQELELLLEPIPQDEAREDGDQLRLVAQLLDQRYRHDHVDREPVAHQRHRRRTPDRVDRQGGAPVARYHQPLARVVASERRSEAHGDLATANVDLPVEGEGRRQDAGASEGVVEEVRGVAGVRGMVDCLDAGRGGEGSSSLKLVAALPPEECDIARCPLLPVLEGIRRAVHEPEVREDVDAEDLAGCLRVLQEDSQDVSPAVVHGHVGLQLGAVGTEDRHKLGSLLQPADGETSADAA
eukprot:756670-Hanusia_phi.AAC.11